IRDLPRLRHARAMAHAEHEAAERAAREAEGAWLRDREEAHRPEHTKALAEFVTAMEAAERAHDAYCAVWTRVRTDGARYEHCGWPNLAGREDMHANLVAWKHRLRRAGWLL